MGTKWCTLGDRVLLHLINYQKFRDSLVVPFDVTQHGIAEATGIILQNVSRELKRLMKKGLIEERLAHIEGAGTRRRKVYFLTPLGVVRAGELREVIENSVIKLKIDDKFVEVRISDVGKYIKPAPSLVEIVQCVKDGILDLSAKETKEEKIKLERYKTRFVGRHEELTKLKGYLRECVRKGRGYCIFIAGEAGIGKTRLVSKVIRYARSKGFQVLMGRGLYGENVEPYLPFIEALKDYEKESGILPVVENKDKLLPSSENEFKIGREHIFEGIRILLKKISDKKPVLLFLDDLHWFDVTSLHLLYYIVRNLSNMRLLVICTYRPEEVTDDHPLADVIERMQRENLFETILLHRLSKEDTEKLITSLLKAKPSRELVDRIYCDTMGNPLFVEEMLRMLMERFVLVQKDEKVYFIKSRKIQVPKMLETIIKRRVRTLDANARKVLMYAAVMGDVFQFETLLNTTNMSEEDLVDALDTLLYSGLIREKEERYEFEHPLTRVVVYEMMSKQRKRFMHKKVAMTLEKMKEIDVAKLAYHYYEAKIPDKALQYLLTAGENAARRYANEEAIKYYERAWECIHLLEAQKKKPLTTEQKLDILCKIGDLHGLSGRYDKAMKYYKDALELAMKTHNKKHVTKLYRKIGEACKCTGNFDKALLHYKKALELLDESDTAFKGTLYNDIGWIYFNKGKYDRALEYCQSALAIAEKCGDKKLIAQSYHVIGTVYIDKGDYKQAIKYLKIAIKMRDEMDDLQGLGASCNNLAIAYEHKGSLKSAIKYYSRAEKCFEYIGDKRMIAVTSLNIGSIYMKMGELKKATDYYSIAIEIFRQINERYLIALYYYNISYLHLYKGKIMEALKSCKEALKEFEEIDIPVWAGRCYVLLSEIHYEMGQLTEAINNLRKSEEILSKLPNEFLPECYALLCKYSAVVGDFDNALNYGEKALLIAKNKGTIWSKALAHMAMGIAYREIKNWEKSMRYFEHSIKSLRKAGYRVILSEVFYEYALLFVKRGKQGDGEVARKYLKDALSLCEKIGMKHCIKKCMQALEKT